MTYRRGHEGFDWIAGTRGGARRCRRRARAARYRFLLRRRGTGKARVFLLYTPNGFERVFSEHRTADYIPGLPGPTAARHDLAVLGRAFDGAGLVITGPHPRDAA